MSEYGNKQRLYEGPPELYMGVVTLEDIFDGDRPGGSLSGHFTRTFGLEGVGWAVARRTARLVDEPRPAAPFEPQHVDVVLYPDGRQQLAQQRQATTEP